MLARLRARSSMLVTCAILLAGGCGPTPPPVATFLPMNEAVRIVNDNNTRLAGRLFGRGEWSGKMTLEDGRTESPNGSFDLHFVAPDKLCFRTRGLGGNYFDAGCNAHECWFWMQYERDELILGTREAMADTTVNGIPLQPDGLLDALGASPLSVNSAGPDAPLYRVDDDHHQLLYESVLDDGRPVVTREYWLSRYEPFLLERVLYRSVDGRVLMDARLFDFQPLPDGGPLVARKIEIHWPLHGSKIKLDFRELKLYDDVNPIWFTQPAQRNTIDSRHRVPQHIRQLDE